MKYNKQPISISDQIFQLRNRGLIIDDEDVARRTLSIISYFRFANYLRPYEADKVNHVFKPGKLFSNAVSLYYFDKVVARSFNVPQHVYLESWIASIAALRNCCAHHARVWNRVYPIKPQLPAAKRMRSSWIEVSNVARNRLYAILCCLIYWVDIIQPDNMVKTEIVKPLDSYPIVDTMAMGFPSGWGKNALWNAL